MNESERRDMLGALAKAQLGKFEWHCERCGLLIEHPRTLCEACIELQIIENRAQRDEL